jgi:hypothetical protein
MPGPTQPTSVTLSKSGLAALFQSTLQDVLATERPLGAAAIEATAAVSQQLAPIVAAEVAELVTATDPTRPEAYLQGLAGIVQATAAGLALDGIAANRELAIRTIQNALFLTVRIVAGTLKIAAFA